MESPAMQMYSVYIPTYQPVGNVQVSPNSGRRTFIPDVDDLIKPQMYMLFNSLENAFLFYQRYAKAGGFTVRKGTQYEPRKGVIHNKWVPSIRTGCEACIRVKLNPDNLYFVYHFEESHNHSFVAEDDRYLLPENRSMNYVQEEAVNALSAINVGPVRAFNIMRTLYGGFDKVGATKVDFKNFKRDLNRYIAEYDADMVIKHLRRKKEFMPNFSMEYLTTADGVLRALFWADGDSKRNFNIFGDVVSFDATYRRNKYNMMFVPFTSVDNHYRNVTLGDAIIGDETAETYSWLLNAFRQAFGRAPPVIVTDHDPAMRKAIQDTWPESRHRLCMWHIMEKLTTKVGANLCNSTDFKKRLCDIVWTDALLPEQFETEWGVILADFDLVNHEWLQSIYQIRDTWIPAYYRDQHMSGLMRTSSRSESENHFFGHFCNPNCTLVEFLGHFDSAIEAQRHEHRKNDHDTRHTNPQTFAKEFVLEQQAANIYTRTIFVDAQLEIQTAIHKCGIGKWDDREDNFVNISVKDFSQTCTTFFQVMMRQLDMTVSCSCNMYEQFGLLCAHIFCVLRFLDIKQFPERYIMRRWTREAVPNSAPGAILGISESDDRYQQVNGVVMEITRSAESLINRLVPNFDALCAFRDHVVQYQSTADQAVVNAPPRSRRDRFGEITGYTQETPVTVRMPKTVRFKGMGKPSRMKSNREMAIIQSAEKKKGRECSNCKRRGHNIRTCTYPAREKADGSSESDEAALEGDDEEELEMRRVKETTKRS
ncbi:protein FAR1-RELATED SEQUENCE 5-like [Helianthus annuus]|uniref:protein FAR1-RELATED SEQUENCE 5-like n=1 Tax=Helianthus annuus TaxID=4232 RepID=UPI000B908549|nr:protein FAR1-RELATED SEQUENCE 5-like [Helianthus annuus]